MKVGDDTLRLKARWFSRAMRCWLVFGLAPAGSFAEGEQRANESLPQEEARVVAKVADAFYRQVGIFLAKEREQTKRHSSVGPRREEHSPKTANGRVVDRRGVAVEGAEVLILDGFHGKAIGCAKTGVDGSFSLTLEKEVCEVSFEVTKPGFARWAWIEDGDALVDRLVCLEREISRERIAEITAEKDLEERLWRILEVLHGGDELFAYIGDMRPDLLRIANSGAFSRLDSRYESPLTRALLLLMLWQDPQDQELLARALMKALNEPENENYRFCRVCFLSRLPEKEIAGKSFDEVIDRWYEWHCIQEKINGRRPPHCVKKKIVDLSEQHAYITIDVRYAHWGYEQNLVLLRTEGLWRLKLNITGLQYNLR